MVEATGGVEGVCWVEQLLPELIWLGLLNDFNPVKGPSLAVSLMRAAKEATGELPEDWFATASSYTRLTSEQKRAVEESLKSTSDLVSIQSALRTLIELYPNCPLAFLFENEPPASPAVQSPNIEEFKRILASLMNRWNRPATLAQASVVYLGFTSGMLKVMQGMALANFPEVFNFPTTEESMMVASSVRATVSVLFGIGQGSKQSIWAIDFWNRGFELQPCEDTWVK